MPSRFRLVVGVALAFAGLVIGACGGDGGENRTGEADSAAGGTVSAATYVGRVEGSSLAVALVADEGRVVGYICDGRQVSTWFEDSSFDGTQSDLETRDGRQIGEATLDAGSAAGEIEVDGERRGFVAQTAEDEAGLYRRSTGEPGKEGFRETGWIVLNDGSVKGATNVLLGDGSVRITDGTSNTKTEPKGKVTTLEGFGSFEAK